MAGFAKATTTPQATPISLKKQSSSGGSQNTILNFFQKRSTDALQPQVNGASKRTPSDIPKASKVKRSVQRSSKGGGQVLTPAPSSDAVLDEDIAERELASDGKGSQSLPSPSNSIPGQTDSPVAEDRQMVLAISPSRKVKKVVSYAESGDDEEDEDVFIPAPRSGRRRLGKRQKTTVSSDEESFSQAEEVDPHEVEDDFMVADDSDEPIPSKKRKRSVGRQSQQKSSPEASINMEEDIQVRGSSSTQQWTYDPSAISTSQPTVSTPATKSILFQKPTRGKAHKSEPSQRYPWLAEIMDADRHRPDHPDYDPRTVFIPPLAWSKFSPFEKQYWEIKQNLWDTIVFFKKGKFYELYEDDATIGHTVFDLKMTDRVNMRMVGVPEMSLNHWANQFVAKGYKIARVDQCESALGKEMRERDDDSLSKSKEPKIITRELACVLTGGTLVDGGMLQNDMSTHCVAIKESVIDGCPAFGIVFVDAATGQFSFAGFEDDLDLTKFETFIAQIRPQELILEKSCLSSKALRILKNSTGLTCIWNRLKPGKEFWDASTTRREMDTSNYFSSEESASWPPVLEAARDKDLVMSAFGALVWYLKSLLMERELLSLANFQWYDPIQKLTNLVLDGQTLINMEIFANSFDGGEEGTLFSLLNRCITPFGKRLFKQWVCHPLVDAAMINARLDAVEALNADDTFRDRFTGSLSKMPDLERLISRVHAGSCKAQDFVRVLEGFEQIEYTMGLLNTHGSGEGVIGQLIESMPDLPTTLEPWRTAFDRKKAKDHGLLVPEPGVEEDFDRSQAKTEEVRLALDQLLQKARKNLKSNSICFRDNGKEIYQLEVPKSVSGVPKDWQQMSATQQVKRFYSPELKRLVRQLQEAQETHGQIVKEVAARFYQRFDLDYSTWLEAVRVISQLDCLISLARASAALGEPCCRPVFLDDPRSVLEFDELRHPCVLPNVNDFIPNDVKVGGDAANINLLTGANAAGKSTVLRMTCIAVIMAQIGCYVPCTSARLTPVDRIMSRLGANDNIFAAQSTFFVELSETKKILSEATPRSLVILDELGRGTSSYDGLAVAQAVLHHVATHIGCVGFFATHYHSLADEFAPHPEIATKRMQIHVDDDERRVTFLYKLEDGVAEGSFGMHCAAMCGIPAKVIDAAEEAAKKWEHTSRMKESLATTAVKMASHVPLGMQSDVAWILKESVDSADSGIELRGLEVLMRAIEAL